MIRNPLIAVILAAMLVSPTLGSEAVYNIGNSLTWDSSPDGVAQLAAQRGYTLHVGYQINCSKTLDYIWNDPSGWCVQPASPYGTHDNALPNYQWTAVTLQPFPDLNYDGTLSDLSTDTARILDFIGNSQSDNRNADTIFYIYASWPAQSLGSYHSVWTQDRLDQDDTPTLQTSAYFDHLIQRVRNSTQADIRMIPVGYVLDELDQRLQAGELAGYNGVAQWYRDDVHLNDMGRYVAGITSFATLYGQNPAGMTATSAYNGSSFSQEFYSVAHDAVWDVVTSMHDVTGVPEPGTVSLLAIAGLVCLGYGWRRRRQDGPHA